MSRYGRDLVRPYVENTACPECGHPWDSHRGRNGGQRCLWRGIVNRDCPCRRKNPEIEAEDRLAAALWNGYMGRDSSGRERDS